ncbi:MAG TPA: hypothetical protein VM144_04830 [Aestuariivirga sp.]|nr:hypothetical protein [Aestuariivirga sp.]
MENAALALLVGLAGAVSAVTVVAGSWLEQRESRRFLYYRGALAWDNATGTDPKVDSTKPVARNRLK